VSDRPWQFSLRGLFITTTALGVCLAIFPPLAVLFLVMLAVGTLQFLIVKFVELFRGPIAYCLCALFALMGIGLTLVVAAIAWDKIEGYTATTKTIAVVSFSGLSLLCFWGARFVFRDVEAS
jgi:hypothetical protein